LPLSWAIQGDIIGPKPEFANYTNLLRQIPEFSHEMPMYIILNKVVLF
jgi:hypothetical protein